MLDYAQEFMHYTRDPFDCGRYVNLGRGSTQGCGRLRVSTVRAERHKWLANIYDIDRANINADLSNHLPQQPHRNLWIRARLSRSTGLTSSPPLSVSCQSVLQTSTTILVATIRHASSQKATMGGSTTDHQRTGLSPTDLWHRETACPKIQLLHQERPLSRSAVD